MKNKSLLLASEQSLEHWKELVEGIKKLIETKIIPKNGYPRDYALRIREILGQTWLALSCELCKVMDGICQKCPLTLINDYCQVGGSSWEVTAGSKTFTEFLDNAEKFMIPALEKAIEYCKEKGL